MDPTYNRGPLSLRELGLLEIADISANGLLNFVRNSRRNGRVLCFDKETIEKESDILAIRNYIEDLPQTLFDQYARNFMTSEATRKVMDVGVGSCHKCIKLVLNQIVSEKLRTFTSIHLSQYFNSNQNASVLLKKVSECAKLHTLSLTSYPDTELKFISLSRVLQYLPNLTNLTLSPTDGRSFHWAIRAVCLQCPHLTDLWVVYDGSLFEGEEGIGLLRKCKDLQTLWLLDVNKEYASYSARAVSDACVLLTELTKLMTFYHRSVLDSLREVHDRSFGTDNPTTLRLKCLYSFEVRINDVLSAVKICPDIELLNLMDVTESLQEVMTSLPMLRALTLGGFYVNQCLPHYFQSSSFPRLKILKLEDFQDIDHDFFSACAHTCPSLQVLVLRHCRITATGELTKPRERTVAFPCLRKLILTPLSRSTTRALNISNDWEVGTTLIRYIVSGTNKLNYLHLHLRHGPDTPQYEWFSQDFLDEVLLQEAHPELFSLELAYPSEISLSFVESLIKAHKSLHSIRGIITWPLSLVEVNKLLDTHGNIDVKGNCVCANPMEWGRYVDHEDAKGKMIFFL